MSEELTVHIRCSRTGTWCVEVEADDPRPVSEHPSETAAESAVRDRYGGRSGRVVVHDRYARVRSRDLRTLPRAAEPAGRRR